MPRVSWLAYFAPVSGVVARFTFIRSAAEELKVQHRNLEGHRSGEVRFAGDLDPIY
jgi:hypothetical protein